jgi:aerobic carbon-monoxide dehydrogenase medium subunit
MKAAAFTYHDPRSLNDLYALLASLENVRVLAGGQSLMPMLNMRYAFPDHVIDLNRIDGLSDIRMTEKGLYIGAMVRQAHLKDHPLVAAHAPVLAEALHWVGHVQTRSRGTIGGSLCHLDPAAEQPCIAALYDAVLHVGGPRGLRDIVFSDWCVGYMAPALEPDEVLVGLTLPVWQSGAGSERHGHGFHEFARRHGDYAIVAAAVLIALDPQGSISRAAISLAGVDVKPRRLEEAEHALVGRKPETDLLRTVAEKARALDMMEDAHIRADYRQRLAVTLTKRALNDAVMRAQGGHHG